MLKRSDFIEVVTDIVQMNRMVQDGDPTGLELSNRIHSQIQFLQSEFDETYNAIFQSDRKEIVDGVCDMFVVWSYYYFMMSLQYGDVDLGDWAEMFARTENDCITGNMIIGRSPLTKYIDAGSQVIPVDYAGAMGLCLNNIIRQHIPDVDIAANLRAVSKSNWTKFPEVYSIDDPVDECRRIEDNYRITKDEEVEVEFVVRKDSEGVNRYVFKNKETGKFLKPTMFEEPELVF